MWRYGEVPDALKLPACPRCSNRMRVAMVLRCVFLCGDCGHAFSATWEAERPAPAVVGRERTA